MNRLPFRAFASGFLLLLSGCSTTLPELPKSASYALPSDSKTKLAQYTQPIVEPFPELTGFHPLADGKDAFIARLAVIQAAEQSLDVQYYIYRDDITSTIISMYLYQAAERGVRVRILLDDMQNRNDEDMVSISAHPNIEVRLFNPFSHRTVRAVGFLNDFDQLHRRMHNKALLADGIFAITGGRNIGDEYFSANGSVEFGDFDLLLVGDVVPPIANQFDVYWNSEFSTPIEHLVGKGKQIPQQEIKQWYNEQYEHIADSPYFYALSKLPIIEQLKTQALPFFWGEAELHYDLPSKLSAPSTENPLLHQISTLLEHTQHELLLISPYFVPTEEGAEALAQAARDGKKITIITNSLASNDVFAVHGWYAKRRQTLLAAGVKLYETKVDPQVNKQHSWLGSSRTSLHAKTYIMDREQLFVGSFNFDPRSAQYNTEMGVVIDSPVFAAKVYQALEPNLKKNTYRLALDSNGDVVWIDDHKQQTLTSEPDVSYLRRFGAWFSGILPIEDLL
ncbi:cardiolipin synthetase [Photobacterium jeanii]|uniref:Cardiolipin synthetase n=1 Tax=Photobacterium jeanii TaxID=858640 RepID=A0A178K139_9GAMM|nr:phospholipase D family protein [Photobacterium jeanii]OAN11038.1 cardiolipin synthetase [Photobacterium jeanii]PST90551.1 phospholipase D family protein [Photobacterium jeanii]